jgi:hypothetical protein
MSHLIINNKKDKRLLRGITWCTFSIFCSDTNINILLETSARKEVQSRSTEGNLRDFLLHLDACMFFLLDPTGFSRRELKPTNCTTSVVSKVFNAATSRMGKPPQNRIWKVEAPRTWTRGRGEAFVRCARVHDNAARISAHVCILPNLPSFVVLCTYALFSEWETGHTFALYHETHSKARGILKGQFRITPLFAFTENARI